MAVDGAVVDRQGLPLELGVVLAGRVELRLDLVDQLLGLLLAAERPAGEQGLLLPRRAADVVLVALRDDRRDARQQLVGLLRP